MALISFTDIQNNTTADANDVNDIFDIIFNEFNGNIEAANIKDSTITAAKLANDAITMTKYHNPYGFRASRQSTQAITGANKMLVNNDSSSGGFDTNSNFDTGANARYTAPVDGVYIFGAEAMIGADDARFFTLIYKNGAELSRGSETTKRNAQCVVLTQMAAGDYTEGWASTAAAQTLQPGFNFWGYLLQQTS